MMGLNRDQGATFLLRLLNNASETTTTDTAAITTVGAQLYSTFLKPGAGDISAKTSGNRGPVAQGSCATSACLVDADWQPTLAGESK
jgi:hypothetical protein